MTSANPCRRLASRRLARPRIVLLNQVVGPVFRQLSEELAEHLGPAWLLTGSLGEIQTIRHERLRLIPAANYRRGNTWDRLTSWLIYFAQAARIVAASPRQALLFIVSNPPFLPLLGWLASIARSQRYAVLVYDIYPDILISAGRTASDSLLARAWRAMNRLVWNRATMVLTIGRYMARKLETMFEPARLAAGKIEVIPNWADIAAVAPLAKADNPFAVRHGQCGKLTVLYCGNVGESHDIESLIEAADRLRSEGDINFMIVGRGARWDHVRREIAARSLTNVIMLGWQHESQLRYVLTTGDVAVVSLDAGFEALSVPSRVYYALAAGSAILAVSRGPDELQELIEQHRCGLHVQPRSPDALAAAIRRFRDDPDMLEQCRRNARLAAERYFSRPVCAARYVAAVSSVLEAPKASRPNVARAGSRSA